MPDVLVDRRMGHVSISGEVWLCRKHEFLHHLKMMRDTPPDMRWSLPWFPLWRPIIKIVTPWWVRHPRKAYRRVVAGVPPWEQDYFTGAKSYGPTDD
jgi:hypothetical protein